MKHSRWDLCFNTITYIIENNNCVYTTHKKFNEHFIKQGTQSTTHVTDTKGSPEQ